jgi:hypothetical protein
MILYLAVANAYIFLPNYLVSEVTELPISFHVSKLNYPLVSEGSFCDEFQKSDCGIHSLNPGMV